MSDLGNNLSVHLEYTTASLDAGNDCQMSVHRP